MTRVIEKFAALIHTPWIKYDSTTIEGYWGEDGSPYKITAPHQLVSMLVEMQNALSYQYAMYRNARNTMYRYEDNFYKIFG
jgi:hypothetical protein